MTTETAALPEGLDEAKPSADTPAADAKPAKKPKNKKLLIGGAAVALLLAAGGGYMLLPGGGGSAGHGEEATAEAAEGEGEAAGFVEVPPMTVNLRSADGSTKFLKVQMTIVPGKKAPDEITKKLPLVLDAYQPFLRELRPEDLAGSAATFRIKEEMLVRANAALGAGAVKDVLIQDLLQQ